MSLGHGYTTFVGIAPEVTFGTPVNPVKFIEIESESIKLDQKRNVVPLLGNVSQLRTVSGKKNVAGGIVFPFVTGGIELILKHAFGSAATIGPSGGLYTHTFGLSNELPVGLTIEVNRDDAAVSGNRSFQYSGCKINKLSLSQEMDRPLMVEVEIIGKDMALKAAASVSYPTYTAFDYAGMTQIAMNAGTIVPARSWKLTIDNALHEDQYRLGSTSRAGITRGAQRKVMFETELEFDDTGASMYDLFKALTITDVAIIYAAGTHTLSIDLAALSLEGDQPTVSEHGPIYFTLKGTALSLGGNDEVEMMLQNAVSSIP